MDWVILYVINGAVMLLLSLATKEHRNAGDDKALFYFFEFLFWPLSVVAAFVILVRFALGKK